MSLANTRLLTIAEVAEKLRVSRRTVRHWLQTGRLTGLKIGGQWRVKLDVLEEFIRQAEQVNKPNKNI